MCKLGGKDNAQHACLNNRRKRIKARRYTHVGDTARAWISLKPPQSLYYTSVYNPARKDGKNLYFFFRKITTRDRDERIISYEFDQTITDRFSLYDLICFYFPRWFDYQRKRKTKYRRRLRAEDTLSRNERSRSGSKGRIRERDGRERRKTRNNGHCDAIVLRWRTNIR